MPAIRHEPLHAYVVSIFEAAGSEEREARLIADHLVEANLVGHDSHGVGMIPLYLEFLAKGQVRPNQHLTVVNRTGAVAVVDGNRGYGQVIAYETMQLAVEIASEFGVAVTALRNSFHVGRIGHWAQQCARAGMVSLHFVNVIGHDPLVAPYGGGDARFATNPVSIALPGEDGPLCMLDMATSKIALGKARVALNAGTEVPEGTLIDAEGSPTRDPAAMFSRPQGALVAMGEHKGSGLAIMAELLAGALGGATTMQPEHPRPGGPVNGMLSVVIDPATTSDRGFLEAEARAFLDYVKASPPRDPGGEVLVPGEPEQRSRRKRMTEGIPLSDGDWRAIGNAVRSLGVDPPAGCRLLE